MNCIIDGEDICREFLNEHDEISEEVKDLAMTMVRMDPNARPSCAEALEHPWFSKHDFYQTMLENTKSRLVVRKDAKLADPEEFRLKENLNMS
jgi:serine/threonine protein kinase